MFRDYTAMRMPVLSRYLVLMLQRLHRSTQPDASSFTGGGAVFTHGIYCRPSNPAAHASTWSILSLPDRKRWVQGTGLVFWTLQGTATFMIASERLAARSGGRWQSDSRVRHGQRTIANNCQPRLTVRCMRWQR